MTSADIFAPLPPIPRERGPWRFDPDRGAIVYTPSGHELDLERCTSSAATLDAIMQHAGKAALIDELALGHLVRFVFELLDPQATLCSFGVDQALADPWGRACRAIGMNGGRHG